MNVKYLLLPLFLSAAVLAIHVFCLASTAAVPSPVMVAFSAEGPHGLDTINVYGETTGLCCTVKSSGIFEGPLYGYDALSDTWLKGAPSNSGYGPELVVKFHNGKRTTARLVKFPRGGVIQRTVLAGGTLIVSSVGAGRLVLSSYNLKGSLKSRRILTVPNRIIVDVIDLDTARGDLVAATLLMKDTMRSELCIFDGEGLLKERIGRGVYPRFDPAGRHLAYRDYSVVRNDSTGEQSISKDDIGNIVVYDLQTKTRRVVSVGNPPASAHSAMPAGSAVDEYYWSPDGRSLVCSYMQGELAECSVYLVDIATAELKWKKLPIVVYGGDWTVLDKMPPTHCK